MTDNVTPRPWRVNVPAMRHSHDVYGPKGVTVSFGMMPGDAALTVRAVNAHDALVKAAKRALAVFKAQGESVRPGSVLGALDEALKLAEE